MNKEYLEIYGGNITPTEMHDALIDIINYFAKEGTPDIPKVMETLNCLSEFVKDEFDLNEQDICE